MGEKTLEADLTQYGTHRFPLAIVGRSDRSIVTWLQGYEAYWRVGKLPH
jgi:hypothetical protein